MKRVWISWIWSQQSSSVWFQARMAYTRERANRYVYVYHTLSLTLWIQYFRSNLCLRQPYGQVLPVSAVISSSDYRAEWETNCVTKLNFLNTQFAYQMILQVIKNFSYIIHSKNSLLANNLKLKSLKLRQN